MIIAYIFIDSHLDQETTLAEYLRDLREVEEVMITTGSSDVICRVVTETLEEFYHFTIDELEKRSEIIDMRTSVVTKEINT
ncbi:MAG: Lrp/AsnC ligand binding domain-containing protein [Candidatus Kariarchaeaceae archaeon]